jgi:hypothetical protein
MSAIGTKRTSVCVASMSALEVKRASHFALQMSAFDPKRTLSGGLLHPTMELGKRTIDCKFYNHLSEMRASSGRTHANRRLSVLL